MSDIVIKVGVKECVKIEEDGTFYVNGEKTKKDIDVYNGFKSFLMETGKFGKSLNINRDAFDWMVGKTYMWEPEGSRKMVRVDSVEWNGEEYWVNSTNLDEDGGKYPNELSRFLEAISYGNHA